MQAAGIHDRLWPYGMPRRPSAPPAPRDVMTSGSQPQSEPKFQALLESAPDAIIIVRANGQIAIANGQAERLFGYPRSELIDQPIEILLPEHLRGRHTQHRTSFAS